MTEKRGLFELIKLFTISGIEQKDDKNDNDFHLSQRKRRNEGLSPFKIWILNCTFKPIKVQLWPLLIINTRFLRERGMASTSKMEYQIFLCIFQKNSAMATLGLKEMGKFLWEGREKGLPCWLSQFIKTKLRQSTGFCPYLKTSLLITPSVLAVKLLNLWSFKSVLVCKCNRSICSPHTYQDLGKRHYAKSFEWHY